MPIALVINGTTYQYPVPGEDPTWGADATDWAAAVTAGLSTLLGPGDILQSTFTINNNVAVATNINGLIFDSGTIRSATIDYAVYRTSDTNPSGYAESGRLYIVNDDSAVPGSIWQLSQSFSGNSGISFSIDDSGQLKYISNDIGVTNYSGTIRFSAKALTKI